MLLFFLKKRSWQSGLKIVLETLWLNDNKSMRRDFSSSEIRLVYLGRNKEKKFFLIQLVNRGLEGIVFVEKKSLP